MSVSPDEPTSAEPVRTGTVEPAREETSRSAIGMAIAVVVATVCGIYLANPTFGMFEAIPDALPGIGNLDEATAMAILLSCLGYLGIRLPFLSDWRASSRKR